MNPLGQLSDKYVVDASSICEILNTENFVFRLKKKKRKKRALFYNENPKVYWLHLILTILNGNS